MAKLKSFITKLDTFKVPIIWSGIASLWHFGGVPFYKAVGSVFSALFAGAVTTGLVEKARLSFVANNHTPPMLKLQDPDTESEKKSDKEQDKIASAKKPEKVEIILNQEKKPEPVLMLAKTQKQKQKRKHLNNSDVCENNILPEGTKRLRRDKPASFQ